LLLNPPETPIREVMVENVIALPADATLLDACDLFLFHRLLALPVVDAQGHVLGIVDVELYTEEISDLARHAESDDIFQLIGVNVASVRQASIPAAFRARFPWLLANIAGGLGCAVIGALYQQILDAVVALALFIPVVLALAESVSIQSLTLALQAQHGPRPRWMAFLKKFGRDLAVGLLLGLGCGGLVALVAWLWQGRGLVALCLAIGIALSITTASVVGVLVPTLFRSASRDPKVASGPITLAVTDLATLSYYLGFATLLLG
jgi:magnesium transporter